MSQEVEVPLGRGGVIHAEPSIAEIAESGLKVGQLAELSKRKQRSLWGNAFRQFRQHRLAMAGLVVIIFFLLTTVIGSQLYPRDIDEIDFMLADATPTWSY